ncbi:hypothetical protein AB0K21_07315 [Streptosporangium sp. NPDC049248]|uniref:hypothetical protein n=1 Tax=Streptosporangium sp. NPDC049248 TaxID=3155651 RepID=UPI00344A480E
MRLPVLLLLGALTACGAPATMARTPDIPATASAPSAREAPEVLKASATPPPSPASTDPTPESACAPAPTRKLNVRLLRQTAFDYDPLNSPEELAEKTPLVVAGTVEDFLPGQIVEEGIPGDRTHYLLMPVRVTERFKGPAARLVHVKFFQGGIWRNQTPVNSVADFRRAVPRGSRVMLFVYPDVREGTVIKDRAALPAGTPIYSAHPQGVLLGRGLTVIGGMEEINPASRWADPCGLDGIATRLRAAGHQGH